MPGLDSAAREWEEEEADCMDDVDNGCVCRTLTVDAVMINGSFVRINVEGGGVLYLTPEHVVQFSLGDNLKPGAVLEVKTSRWPGGGVEDIRAV